MKRIVDIPDEVLENKHYCQYFGAWSTKLTELIEQSTPYNPSGDAISREALKEAISYHCEYLHDSIMDLEDILDLIDIAPTVEPDMEFAKWVTKMIFGNDEVEDFDFELFSELACRKLEKMGLVEKTESEWKMKGGAE